MMHYLEMVAKWDMVKMVYMFNKVLQQGSTAERNKTLEGGTERKGEGMKID